MTTPIRPSYGGFLRPFGTAWFIIEYLKGNGPEDSMRIDPAEGACMTDIHAEYKSALHRAHARDTVERVEEKRIRRGKPAFTEEEYNDMLEYYLSRIPYKLTKMRYSSFTRYFGHLKRLGWVEETGREDESYIQGLTYADAPHCRYYRLSTKGKEAPEHEWYRPQLTLYPQFTPEYFAQKNTERRQNNKTA